MMNGCFLIGKVCEKPTYEEKEKKEMKMVVRVDHPYRNIDGTLSCDEFKIKLWRGIGEEVKQVCDVGTIVAIRGRLCSKKESDDNYNAYIIAESVSYPDRNSVINHLK